jgi:hypothetical protein
VKQHEQLADNTERGLRHIPWTYSDKSGFGHHYINKDKRRNPDMADQFDIAVHHHGNSRLPVGHPLRELPHIEIRTFDGNKWRTESVTPITRQITDGIGCNYPDRN